MPIKKRPNEDKDIERKIEDFGNKADDNKTQLNPKAPRKHKSLTIPFNEYEFERLTSTVDASTYPSQNSFIRAAIEEKIRKELKNI